MKKKLTIDEQIIDLEEKGVTFNIMNDDEAKIFLRYNNYYFKLKSYASNYPINPKNNKPELFTTLPRMWLKAT